MPIQCQSNANPTSIKCQSGSDLSSIQGRPSRTNPLPILFQFTISMQIYQSNANPLPIHSNLPIHHQSFYRTPIGTNLPIHQQTAHPMPILDQSSNLKTICQSANPPILCNSTTNHTVQCQLNPSPIHQSFTNPRPTHQVDQSSITNNPPNCKNRRHSSHPQRHSIGNGRANTRPIRVTNAHLSALIIETEQPPIDGASARIEKQHANRRSIRLPTRR